MKHPYPLTIEKKGIKGDIDTYLYFIISPPNDKESNSQSASVPLSGDR